MRSVVLTAAATITPTKEVTAARPENTRLKILGVEAQQARDLRCAGNIVSYQAGEYYRCMWGGSSSLGQQKHELEKAEDEGDQQQRTARKGLGENVGYGNGGAKQRGGPQDGPKSGTRIRVAQVNPAPERARDGQRRARCDKHQLDDEARAVLRWARGVSWDTEQRNAHGRNAWPAAAGQWATEGAVGRERKVEGAQGG